MRTPYGKILAISLTVSIVFSSLFAVGAILLLNKYYPQQLINSKMTVKVIDEESSVIDVVQKAAPGVVSIIVTKNLPVPTSTDLYVLPDGTLFEQSQDASSSPQEVGGGSGFIINPDGYIATNRHVVDEQQADYTVLLNNGVKYKSRILAVDQISDLAILKIDAANLPTVELGDSSNLKVGQRVVAIGNALGEFKNTVSTGVISGLSRSIVAGGESSSEQLFGVIQTDASINPGNSGGPLLNIEGQVIGINVAVAQGAQGIGFALPINEVKNSIDSVKRTGKIIRPWLGVRFLQIDAGLQEERKLPVDYGALIAKGSQPTDVAVVPGSPASKAGLEENDIILEVNNTKINLDNPLAYTINKYKVGDTVTLKILRNGQQQEVKVTLEEMKPQ